LSRRNDRGSFERLARARPARKLLHPPYLHPCKLIGHARTPGS
jgi:hypothetical protein